jgi:hypothetical protein
MPAGLKQTSSVVAVGFEVVETGANTFTQGVTDLNLSPLDNEVFVVLSINLDPGTPDALAGTDTFVNASLTTTTRTTLANLSDSNCLANSTNAIRAQGFLDSGCAFQTGAIETPPANLDYIGIIATSDFFVQVQGQANLGVKQVTGKIYGYRARADAAVYAALVQSQALSAWGGLPLARYDYDRDDLTDFFRDDRREQERLERMIDDARRMMDREQRQEDPVMRVINDPTIVMTPAQKKAVNDPKVAMNGQRQLVRVNPGRISAGASPLYPPISSKRTRKKTKMDRTMSRCLKEANSKMRKKNGQLRKGKTMRDVMRLAHRLCKKS